MQPDTKSEVLKRLNFIEGHLAGIWRMVEADKYCVDVLKQTYAVRRAIEKMEAIMLEATYARASSKAFARAGRCSARRADELYEMAGK